MLRNHIWGQGSRKSKAENPHAGHETGGVLGDRDVEISRLWSDRKWKAPTLASWEERLYVEQMRLRKTHPVACVSWGRLGTRWSKPTHSARERISLGTWLQWEQPWLTWLTLSYIINSPKSSMDKHSKYLFRVNAGPGSFLEQLLPIWWPSDLAVIFNPNPRPC